MNSDDAGVATYISELIIVGPGEDLASEAAHESYTRKVEIMLVFRARGRGDRIGGAGFQLRRMK